ncbi:cytochrome-c oxidase, cbb3-type subunit III [Ferrimonas balearica]|uniref:cytochrome-c oxidase, cbb3-type subunit III n=1 Tax=Ferrimonas balearica TaxID=44012 RepID=UPI001F42CA3B|nr:cytochrome-c oxidase, cbb3-type subunit III [Ferrimonas balearica]MBY6016595.1 cytochrome-c oxidase, cbb3-type subunit III [Halomonas denitrificans]MBY6095112.1 cytochrome-c oxidase, cbb3-type subunit III [Ferrimonas balearica]
MSNILSVIVIFCVLAVMVGSLLLLIWCQKDKMGKEEGESMGHTFDGIEEINNPLPKWWSYMFVLTIVFGVGYLALYPGMGNFAGLLNWTSANKQVVNLEQSREQAEAARAEGATARVQYDREVAAADDHFGPIFQAFAARSIEDLAQDDEAKKIGQRLFLQNCSQCHGSDAKGSRGFPDLTDGGWLYGGDPQTIKTTILNGRRGMMPPKGGLPITDEEIPALAEYVLSLSGRDHDANQLAAGQAAFMKGCFACHGMDGKGNPLLGAPNLTDDAWVYGGSRGYIIESITNGRAGVMPAWKDLLGEDKVHLITAYVYSLSADSTGSAEAAE